MQTAVELFSTHGFHDVSMHMIAEESGFSTGTLYNFFQDKEDLYNTLVREYYLRFHEELVRVLDSREDEVEVERIRAYVSAKGRIFEHNRPILRIYFAETRKTSFDIKSGLDKELRSIHENTMLKLAGVFESGMRKGLFRRIMEPYYLAVALAGLTNAFLFLWLEDPKKHPYSRNVETIMQLVFRNIIIDPDEKKKGTKRTAGKK